MTSPFRFIFLLAFAVVISVTSCKPGTGTLAITLEADDKATAADVKKVEDVYRQRLEKFGIDEDNILLTTTGNRIKVEISELSKYSPEIRERLRKLLQSSANLEFWETYFVPEVLPVLFDGFITPAKDSTGPDSTRFFAFFGLVMADPGVDHSLMSALGHVAVQDTAAVRAVFDSSRHAFPRDLIIAFTRPQKINRGQYCELVLLKSRNGKPAMAHPGITDARVEDGQGTPQISMTMDKVSGDMWSKLTKANVGRNIAIVLDGTVYSYPTVQSEISGGVSSVSGNFTKQEAEDLANILGVGYLPVRMRIVEEKETK